MLSVITKGENQVIKMETVKRISLTEYMPFRKVPLDAQELIQQAVNKEALTYAHFMDKGNCYRDYTTTDQRMKFRDDINRDYRIAKVLTTLIFISVVIPVILWIIQ
mgnify:CR=1 FL=1